MFTEKNQKTIRIPELSLHYSESHSDGKLVGNVYRMDPVLEL